MTAAVLDQFDNRISADIKWKLSETIDGFTPTSSPSAEIKGVSVDENGVLTVTSDADESENIFLTAFVNDRVKQTYHIRLSREDLLPQRVFFNEARKTVKRGETVDVSAGLYDQYQKAMDMYTVRYQLSEDLTGNTAKAISGVSIASNGILTVSNAVPAGTQLVVTAKAGGKYNTQIIEVV